MTDLPPSHDYRNYDNPRVGEALGMVEVALLRGNREQCDAAITRFFAVQGVEVVTLDSPPVALGLPLRAVNPLEDYLRVYTVRDLVGCTREMLRKVPSFGPNMIDGILAALRKHGFELVELGGESQ